VLGGRLRLRGVMHTGRPDYLVVRAVGEGDALTGLCDNWECGQCYEDAAVTRLVQPRA
jgi:hypothetical protein